MFKRHDHEPPRQLLSECNQITPITLQAPMTCAQLKRQKEQKLDVSLSEYRLVDMGYGTQDILIDDAVRLSSEWKDAAA